MHEGDEPGAAGRIGGHFLGAIVLGSLLLSLVEGGQALAGLPASHATPTPPLMTLPPGAPTYTPSATPSVTPTPTAAPPANCAAVPTGWQAVVIQPDDSLSTIAARYGAPSRPYATATACPLPPTSSCRARRSSCRLRLASPTSPPPTLTPTLRPTRTALACGAPHGWVQYRVRPGETLFGLSIRLGVSQANIRAANCSLQSRTKLIAGELLWVPYIPPAPTLPPTWTRTLPPPTFTATPLPPTPVPTRTSPPPTNTSKPPTRTSPPPTATPLPTDGHPNATDRYSTAADGHAGAAHQHPAAADGHAAAAHQHLQAGVYRPADNPYRYPAGDPYRYPTTHRQWIFPTVYASRRPAA